MRKLKNYLRLMLVGILFTVFYSCESILQSVEPLSFRLGQIENLSVETAFRI